MYWCTDEWLRLWSVQVPSNIYSIYYLEGAWAGCWLLLECWLIPNTAPARGGRGLTSLRCQLSSHSVKFRELSEFNFMFQLIHAKSDRLSKYKYGRLKMVFQLFQSKVNDVQNISCQGKKEFNFSLKSTLSSTKISKCEIHMSVSLTNDESILGSAAQRYSSIQLYKTLLNCSNLGEWL